VWCWMLWLWSLDILAQEFRQTAYVQILALQMIERDWQAVNVHPLTLPWAVVRGVGWTDLLTTITDGAVDDGVDWLLRHQRDRIRWHAVMLLEQGGEAALSHGLIVPLVDKLTQQTYSVQYRPVLSKLELRWDDANDAALHLSVNLQLAQTSRDSSPRDRFIQQQNWQGKVRLVYGQWRIVSVLVEQQRKRQYACIPVVYRLPVIGKIFCQQRGTNNEQTQWWIIARAQLIE